MKIFFSRQKPIQTTVNRRVGLHAHLVLGPVKLPLQISCLLSWSTETTYVRTSDLTLPLNGLLAPFYLFMHKMFEIEKEAEERDFGLHWELEWVESAELENVQIDLDGETTCSPIAAAITSTTFQFYILLDVDDESCKWFCESWWYLGDWWLKCHWVLCVVRPLPLLLVMCTYVLLSCIEMGFNRREIFGHLPLCPTVFYCLNSCKKGSSNHQAEADVARWCLI